MRLLLTGGCGFLGSHIIEHFLKNTDAEIVVLDKLSYASSGFDRLRDIGAYENKRVRILGCDLSLPIPPGVDREIAGVDYVIHAAAETHVDNSITDPLPFITSNVVGTHNLLWWARDRAFRLIRRIFLVSTDEVYGPAKFDEDVKGFDENAPYRPANPYAAAKAGGEAVGMAYANTYGLPITIVNTMNLIGERQHHEKMVAKCIRAALTGDEMPIHADATQTRSGSRFYLHCRNYASALLFLIERSQDRLREMPRKIHVAGEREIANSVLADLIADYVGKPIHKKLVSWHASRPGHDLRYALDDSLIRSMGWVQPLTLDESLKKTVSWYLNNRSWLGL